MSSAAVVAPDPKVSSNPSPKRSVVMLVLVLGTFTAVGPLSTDMYLPAFPQIANDLNAQQSQVQLTLTAAMVGLAIGQLLIGPLSDAVGRRKPMLIGSMCFTLASIACIFVPNVETFIALRFAQGLAGAAGAVVARAIVRDHFEGDNVAKFFSRLVLVSMLAPMLGPILGGQLLKIGPWQLGFVVLTGVSLLGMTLAYFLLPESLPSEKRQAVSGAALRANIRHLICDLRFVGPMLTLALAFGAMFTYISTFSFVAQSQLDASAQQYSVMFGVIAVGMLLGTQVNGFLVGRVDVTIRLAVGLTVASLAVTTLGIMAASNVTNLVAITFTLFTMMVGAGMIFPNCTSLALGSQSPRIAGTGSALLGTIQFAIGGIVPTAATWTMTGRASLLSMAMVMAGALATAIVAHVLSSRLAARRVTASAAGAVADG